MVFTEVQGDVVLKIRVRAQATRYKNKELVPCSSSLVPYLKFAFITLNTFPPNIFLIDRSE